MSALRHSATSTMLPAGMNPNNLVWEVHSSMTSWLPVLGSARLLSHTRRSGDPLGESYCGAFHSGSTVGLRMTPLWSWLSCMAAAIHNGGRREPETPPECRLTQRMRRRLVAALVLVALLPPLNWGAAQQEASAQ
jgi:hypothetical protein